MQNQFPSSNVEGFNNFEIVTCCSIFIEMTSTICIMITFKSILIIEDDAVALFLQKKIVEKAAITNQIIVKTNGEKALRYVKNEIQKGNSCPELIILDLNMPCMDGGEFIDALYAFNCNLQIKIIVVTNSFLWQDKIKNHPWINYYIEKPLTSEKLKNG